MANQASVYHLPKVIHQPRRSSYYDWSLCTSEKAAYCRVTERKASQIIDNTTTLIIIDRVAIESPRHPAKDLELAR